MTTGRGTRVGTGTPPRVPNGTARRAGWNTLDQRRSVPRGGGAGRPGRASGLEGGKRRVGTQGAVLGVTVGCRFGNARVHHRSGSGPAEDERPATTARRARGCNGDAGGAIAGASGGGVGRHGGGAGRSRGGAGRNSGGCWAEWRGCRSESRGRRAEWRSAGRDSRGAGRDSRGVGRKRGCAGRIGGCQVDVESEGGRWPVLRSGCGGGGWCWVEVPVTGSGAG